MIKTNFIQKFKVKRELREELKLQDFLVKTINIYMELNDARMKSERIEVLTKYLEESRSRVDEYRLSLNINSYIHAEKT